MDRRGPDDNERNRHQLETSRLRVEVPEPDDAAPLYGLIGGDDRRAICSTLLWDGPEELAEVERWVANCRSLAYGEWGFHWVIRDSAGDLSGTPGAPMGAIGTRPRGEPGRADVGYWLGRSYWGRGVMSEALSAVVRLGVERLGYAKIEADVFTHNVAGLRLVERVGFEYEGTIRRAHRKYGDWIDEARYGLVVDDEAAT